MMPKTNYISYDPNTINYQSTDKKITHMGRKLQSITQGTSQGLQPEDELTGRDLFLMSQEIKMQASSGIARMNRSPNLKQPENLIERVTYFLALMSSVQPYPIRAKNPGAIERTPANYSIQDDRTRESYLPGVTYQPSLKQLSESTLGKRRMGKRSVRRAITVTQNKIYDWRFKLAHYLNKNARTNINLENIHDLTLAECILTSLAQQPSLAPEITRLTLADSQLYGERRGETRSALQQKKILGRVLCQLIYKEDSISIRLAKLFDKNRKITQNDFFKLVNEWPFKSSDEKIQLYWQSNFEAPEIPLLFWNVTTLAQKDNAADFSHLPSIPDLGNIWVGSLTWTLTHFGARATSLNDWTMLNFMSPVEMMEVGLGFVDLFNRGELVSNLEHAVYLGLLIYYMRAQPEFTLAELQKPELLQRAFTMLSAEVQSRHLTAKRLYDGFSDYQVEYRKLNWRSREASANTLLIKFCGNATTPLTVPSTDFTKSILRHWLAPARQLMKWPEDQFCAVNKTRIPNLDTFYFQEVEKFAIKIRGVDEILLNIVFTPSDINDGNFQHDEYNFFQGAEIKIAILYLIKKRLPSEMFYSNKPILYPSREDTIFFNVKTNIEQRIYALQTTREGYLLRRVDTNDPYLYQLRPFMKSWPVHAVFSNYRLVINDRYVKKSVKEANETLTSFITHFSQRHYQYYLQKIYEKGYDGDESPFPKMLNALFDYVIPFYGCIKSLVEGKQNSAFAECLADGALVALPVGFVGVKAGLSLYRNSLISVGQASVKPAFRASQTLVFKSSIPVSTQIAGGIKGARAQMFPFAKVLGKELLMSFDPGFVPLTSLRKVIKSLYLAALGKAVLQLTPLTRHLSKISMEAPKIIIAADVLDFPITYGYGIDGTSPLTMAVKGVNYPVFQIQNRSLAAVETGELTHNGELVFTQVDLENQLGIYNKYFCLSQDNDHCQLTKLRKPVFTLELNATVSEGADNSIFWLLTSSLPIHVVVTYPFHVVEYADKHWYVFEINGRCWGFSHGTGVLTAMNNSDEWQVHARNVRDFVPSINLGENDYTLQLHLNQFRHRRKRGVKLQHILPWQSLVSNYTLPISNCNAFTADIYENSNLIVKVGQSCYLLHQQSRTNTFLLRHPTQPVMSTFKLSYVVAKDDFVLTSPAQPLNSHHIGELLRHKIETEIDSGEIIHLNRLIPPMFNGAFHYGNVMYLKIGSRVLPICHFEDVYYTVSPSDDKISEWTLRYELFTGSFDLVGSSDPMTISRPRAGSSRFEQLASRVYNQSTYPTLADLCQKNDKDMLFDASGRALQARLRQVELLLRLDFYRRVELLHASSAILRAFYINNALGISWPIDYPILSLYERAEYVISTCLTSTIEGKGWASKTLSHIQHITWHSPLPLLLSPNNNQHIFLLNNFNAPELAGPRNKEFIINILNDRIQAIPITDNAGLRLWLPSLQDRLRTTVSKFELSDNRQPTFWTDENNRIWVQSPDVFVTHLLRGSDTESVDDIVVSPDRKTVVLICERTPLSQRALFYHLPSGGVPRRESEIPAHRDLALEGIYIHSRVWWVSNEGVLFIPRENHWSYEDNPKSTWNTPEGYRPNFVSQDQRYLGFIKMDENHSDTNIILMDTISHHQQILNRTMIRPITDNGKGNVVSVAFSALNIMVAIGFTDGYIEIYRIDNTEHAAYATSLGYYNLPLARLMLPDSQYLKPKQMVMKFNNAFDRIIVFHDIGDFSFDILSSGTYTMSEIFLKK